MRETQFPVISLGSLKPEAPELAELGEWIAKQRGKTADLTSWELETTLEAQKHDVVTQPCAGGTFYSGRIQDAFGFKDGRLEDGFENNFDETGADIANMLKIRRHIWWAVPVDLIVSDTGFKDAEEFEENYAEALAGFCRFMRDCGVAGHVMTGEPTEILLETCRGLKFLWNCSSSGYETVLESSSTLVCGAEDVDLIADLNDSYTVKKVLVKDANRKAMEKLLEIFDADRLYCSGTAPENGQETYWKALSDVKARVSDK